MKKIIFFLILFSPAFLFGAQRRTSSNKNVAVLTQKANHVLVSSYVSLTYEYTGSTQQLRIPFGCSSITVTAQGASGGNFVAYSGSGAIVIATLSVTYNDILYISVGGYDGWNGGGIRSGGDYHHTNGGGATDLRKNGLSLTNRILTAGGGGSPAYQTAPGAISTGGASGFNGNDGSSKEYPFQGGKGGSQESGGDVGTNRIGGYACPYDATSGGLGYGGIGAYNSGGAPCDPNTFSSGAGCGGGGYYGGGGGEMSSGGGGAGSSHAENPIDVTYGTAQTLGNGSITISYYWLQP